MHVQRAGQIDGDQLLPLALARSSRRAEHVPAGVVDQDVDRAELRLCRADGGIDVGPLGDVAGERRGDAAGRPRSRRRPCSLLEIEVEYGDFGAFAGEPAAGRPADAAAAAGDDDDLSRKTRQSFFLPHEFGIATAVGFGGVGCELRKYIDIYIGQMAHCASDKMSISTHDRPDGAVVAKLELGNRLFFRLYQCANMLHKTGSRAVKAEGLTTQQWAVLGALSRKKAQGGMSVGDLARYLMVSRQNLAGLLSRMERDGHVAIAPDARDRRSRLVTMTDAGRHVWSDLALPEISRLLRSDSG